MKIITALNNEKISKELNQFKNINVISKDIQYKEGILEVLEILEIRRNVEYIIIIKDLPGQIKIEDLIKKIKNKNKKIKILIIINKKEKINYLIKNKIKYIYLNKLISKKIIENINIKNKIIAIIGNEGSGKTITTAILSELLIKNKRVLIIEDDFKKNSIKKTYKINNEEKKEIIKIKNNLFIFNLNKFLINNKKIKITNKINEIKNNFDYIFIDLKNIENYNLYETVTDSNVLILNSNIIEINKINKEIFKIKKLNIILNNYNENCISEKIIKNIFKNNIQILEKIKNNKKYNLIINNKFNINYLDKNTKIKYLNIIQKI